MDALQLTPPQLQALDQLLVNTVLVPLLRSQRPALTPEKWQEAKGWEDCVNYIIGLADSVAEPVAAESNYVDVSKLNRNA